MPMPLASLLRDRFLTLFAHGGERLDWSAIAQLAAGTPVSPAGPQPGWALPSAAPVGPTRGRASRTSQQRRSCRWAKGLIKLNLHASRDEAQPTKPFLSLISQVLAPLRLIAQPSTGRIGMTVGKRNLLHMAFIGGIVLKGVVQYQIGGVSSFDSPQSLNRWMLSLIGHGLSEGPNDLLGRLPGALGAGRSAGSITSRPFTCFSRGREALHCGRSSQGKIWAYHTGIVFFLLFIVYQLYRYSYTRSAWLVVLSVFDVVVIYLTWEEYKRVRRSGAASPRGPD